MELDEAKRAGGPEVPDAMDTMDNEGPAETVPSNEQSSTKQSDQQPPEPAQGRIASAAPRPIVSLTRDELQEAQGTPKALPKALVCLSASAAVNAAK